jgi:hypothetical protein
VKITAKATVLLTIPSVLLLAGVTQGVFLLGKVFDEKELQSSVEALPDIATVEVGPLPDSVVTEPFAISIEDISNSDPDGLIRTVVGCAAFERKLEGELDFFVYQSRLSSLRSVNGFFEAQRLIGSSESWMFPVDNAVTYIEDLSYFLGEKIVSGVGIQDVADATVSEIGYQFLDAANVACGTQSLFSETLDAFRTLDSQIVRVVGLVI